MKTAIYGRMHIGRCITAEEVVAQRRLAGDDPQILGCSADVLPMLDAKCSGKTDCNVRLSDIAAENIKPCFPGLVMYLEVSYECINGKFVESQYCKFYVENDEVGLACKFARSHRTLSGMLLQIKVELEYKCSHFHLVAEHLL